MVASLIVDFSVNLSKCLYITVVFVVVVVSVAVEVAVAGVVAEAVVLVIALFGRSAGTTNGTCSTFSEQMRVVNNAKYMTPCFLQHSSYIICAMTIVARHNQPK